jgi:hypothetical protein
MSAPFADNSLIIVDIPYFVRRTNENVPSDKLPVPGELIKAIRRALPKPRLPVSS